MDPREEALLEGVRDVRSAGEGPASTGVCDQLERRLAVAVLEVLRPQSIAMDPQQDLALGARDLRDDVGLVDAA